MFEIVDAANGGGSEGFYFLPPLVDDPGANGQFDAARLPSLVVEICEWTGTDCNSPPVASFTSESGSGSERIRVDGEAEHYIVNWHTDDLDLAPDRDYRLRVLDGPTELGHADVDVVSSGRELRNVNTGQYIALLDGRTLPIKFRIELVESPPAIDGSWEQHFDRKGDGILGAAESSFNTWSITVDSPTGFTAVVTDIVTSDNIAGELRTVGNQSVILMWGPGNRTVADYFHVNVARVRPDGSFEGGWVDVAIQTGDWVLVRPGTQVTRSTDADARVIPSAYKASSANEFLGDWTLAVDRLYDGTLVPEPEMRTLGFFAVDATELVATDAGNGATATGRVLTASSRNNSVVALMLTDAGNFTAFAGSMTTANEIVGVWYDALGASGDFRLSR